MLTGIDHLVIAVADPDTAAAELEHRLGLVAGGGGRHERLGTYNRLVWLGDTYLELIGVFDESLAAASWQCAPTMRALGAGGGLATWAIASDDIDADVAALRSRGSDLAEPVDGERRRPDGREVRWRLSAPPRLDPDRPPFLIEHDTTAAEWSDDDRATRAVAPTRLTVLEVAVEDVNRASQAYLRTTGLRFRPSLAGGGARDAHVGGQTLRLRPRRPGLGPQVTVRLTAHDGSPIEADLLGVRWDVREPPATSKRDDPAGVAR
jgi:Glyoxalase-like domain